MSEGVLVKGDKVGKRFCRSLKPSLWCLRRTNPHP